MMKHKIILTALVVLLLIPVVYSAEEFSLEQAQRVDLVLKRLAKYRKPQVFLRKITFTQDELNSYLNLVYLKKYAPEVKYIKLKLEKDNYASGIVKIKLVGKSYESVPAFLRDIKVETEGKIECRNYRMRFNFEKMKINGTTFSPEVLDEAFGAAQVNYRVKKSLYDWFELMPGIKNIVLDDKKITIFY